MRERVRVGAGVPVARGCSESISFGVGGFLGRAEPSEEPIRRGQMLNRGWLRTQNRLFFEGNR